MLILLRPLEALPVNVLVHFEQLIYPLKGNISVETILRVARNHKVVYTIEDFNRQRKMNPGLRQAVGHISLSCSPNDKAKLNDEIMVSIAKEYLQKMKIQDTQVLMVRHKDRDHPHIHIVYNRVNNDGKTIPDSLQRQKNIKITLTHGLILGKVSRW